VVGDLLDNLLSTARVTNVLMWLMVSVVMEEGKDDRWIANKVREARGLLWRLREKTFFGGGGGRGSIGGRCCSY